MPEQKAEPKAYLVDIKEDPHDRGAILVEATAADGTVEFATFSGPRASQRAMKYVEAIEGFEKRPPREYPKHVQRDGVDHLALDAEHEMRIGTLADEPRPERLEDEDEPSFAARLMTWHKRKNAAKRIVQAQTISESQSDGQVAASDYASKQSIEAARTRDGAARRREPRIENMK